VREPEEATRVVRFGVFEVELRTAELRKQGVRIRLPSQSFQVLEALLLRPGELVTREELKQKLWPSDSFGDFEHGLNAAVNRVRDALGDSSDNPRFVETLPRRGYRFIAPVESSQTERPFSETPPATQVPKNHAAEASRRHRAMKPALFALAAGLVIILSALYLVHLKDKAGSTREADVRVSPLTALPGYVWWPALSPDGKQVVFAWDGGRNAAKSMFDLYIKVIGAERIQQLTHQPSETVIPAWSPDGSTIAFIRLNGQERSIFTMSVLGGPERRLDVFDVFTNAGSLGWSADGRQLVYQAKNDLRLLTVETGEIRTIERPQECKWVYTPVFSPDGKWIALLCRTTSGAVDLYRISPTGEWAKNLHTFLDQPTAIAWSGDSQRIFLADNGGLLEIGANGGQPRRLPFAQTAVSQDDQIASRGNRLVYVQVQDNVNIWRVDLKSGTTRSLLVPTSRTQRAPAISPDGKRIAFESNRSGTQEVWVANLDGSDAVQLSDFHVQTGTPRWSPDGRKIVFDSRASGEAGLYLVDPSTALPRRIFTNGISACIPTWLADGKWIYFTTVSSPQFEHDAIYKVAPQGGTPELVTSTHGFNVQESRDGRVLYFFAGETNAPIQVLDRATGQGQPLKGMPNVGYITDWAVGSKGIFYIDRFSTPAAVAFYEFSSGRVTRRFPIEKQLELWGGLALSPDETWIAYSELDTRGSDLMLADGVQ
jgi:Tol biopolymer transport system component/DNA-binding winged helix-turn-helix (wHTH) protein